MRILDLIDHLRPELREPKSDMLAPQRRIVRKEQSRRSRSQLGGRRNGLIVYAPPRQGTQIHPSESSKCAQAYMIRVRPYVVDRGLRVRLGGLDNRKQVGRMEGPFLLTPAIAHRSLHRVYRMILTYSMLRATPTSSFFTIRITAPTLLPSS
jgi:hypothetical protein